MDFETAWIRELRELLRRGRPVRIGESLSVASGEVTIELLNRSFDLWNPRDRLVYNPIRRFNLPRAVGRFLWMMAASDRVSDIEYYEPRARRFSDDGVTIPGSDDGRRLFAARPGLDQIARVVELLDREEHSRRGAVAVYLPEDAGRRSHDIPCTLSLAYNVRQGDLHATTLMRANDALGVMPYDVFLFSLLAEFVARSLGIPLAQYHHFAVSMHIYERDRARVEAIVASPRSPQAMAMAPMPADDLRDQMDRLLAFERDLRADAPATDDARVLGGYLRRADDELHPYWRDFADLLVFHASTRASNIGPDESSTAHTVLERLGAPFRPLVRMMMEAPGG